MKQVRKHQSARITRRLGLGIAATLAVGVGTAGGAYAAAPAPQPHAAVEDGTMLITGTNGADVISVTADADAASLSIDFGNGTLPQVFDTRTFTEVRVSLLRGDDQFTTAANGSFAGGHLTVDGGQGRDLIGGSGGDDVLFGGPGNDTIHGGSGADLIFGEAGNDTVFGDNGNDLEFLGTGSDTSVWNPGEGSDVVQGQEGTDALAFNGSNVGEKMSLSASGDHAIFFRDVGNIHMDLKDVETLNLTTLAGADTVTINDLAGTGLRQANVDLSNGGVDDGQFDAVIVNGTNKSDRVNVRAEGNAVGVFGLPAQTHVSGAAATDQLQINTLGGNDRVQVDNAAGTLIGVQVDLGTGQR